MRNISVNRIPKELITFDNIVVVGINEVDGVDIRFKGKLYDYVVNHCDTDNLSEKLEQRLNKYMFEQATLEMFDKMKLEIIKFLEEYTENGSEGCYILK